METADRQDWREILIVDAALRTGLLAAFREPATPLEVAERLDLDPRATRITALALADLGYLEAAGESALAWAARAVGILDQRGEEREEAARIKVTARLIGLHLRLGDVLLGAGPVPPWQGDAALAEFTSLMRVTAGERVEDLARALPRPADGARLLDVGGGPGVDAAGLAAAGWSVTVLDLPEVLTITGDELAEAGIAAIAGDATRGLPDGPWDAILVANVLQLLGPEDARALVGRAAGALAPRGVLAALGVLRDLSPHGRLFAVGMLLSTTAGDTHTSQDVTGWMRGAGLRDVRLVELGGGRVLILGDAP